VVVRALQGCSQSVRNLSQGRQGTLCLVSRVTNFTNISAKFHPNFQLSLINDAVIKVKFATLTCLILFQMRPRRSHPAHWPVARQQRHLPFRLRSQLRIRIGTIRADARSSSSSTGLPKTLLAVSRDDDLIALDM
jgi:hypothetical protein